MSTSGILVLPSADPAQGLALEHHRFAFERTPPPICTPYTNVSTGNIENHDAKRLEASLSLWAQLPPIPLLKSLYPPVSDSPRQDV